MPVNPGKFDIAERIREGLEAIHFAPDVGWTEWTQAVLATLCEIGQNLGFYVCCGNAPNAESLGWLYDMTWLKYTAHVTGVPEAEGWLVGVPLVAESEWSSVGEIEDDFTKLLLARASVRLMICYDRHPGGPKGMAKQLAEWVRRFDSTQAEDVYLLAVLGWNDNLEAYGFQYFTLSLSGAATWPDGKPWTL